MRVRPRSGFSLADRALHGKQRRPGHGGRGASRVATNRMVLEQTAVPTKMLMPFRLFGVVPHAGHAVDSWIHRRDHIG